ncbi:sperm-associated microtubule inner protein 4 [Pseudophryne corroboree]|uniref:sperm-associated microtubule inner protein 4 n=1 Tax=Pseudophryne corroboree TaxID=495146 RepID=UPI003081F0B8
MMEVQYNLSHYYRQNEGAQFLSPTLQSSELLTPLQPLQRPTVSPERYHEYLVSTPVLSRVPWGREREYGGIGAVSLPPDHRPKSEPPPLEAKGHRHYGYGGDPWPCVVPMQQNYNITKLKKSAVRISDDLYPKPPAASISDKQIYADFPAEHPYHSHISKFAVFPSFRPTEEPVRSATPLHPHAPSCAYPAIILKKTKGHPYRHEIISLPSDSQKVPMTWPGQQGYNHVPKFNHENNQIYYPIPPKTMAPNALNKPFEEMLSERTVNLQRNLMKSQWVTSYNRSFTDNGEINPLQLDDFHEKVIYKISGRTDENTEMKPTFLSTVLRARPLEGRIARLREGRRPLVKEDLSVDLESKNAHHAHELDTTCVTCMQSSCTCGATGSGLDSCNTAEQEYTRCSSSMWKHKEPSLCKITDTEQHDAFYRRQITPIITSYDMENNCYKDLHPRKQQQYVTFDPSKPFTHNDPTNLEACSVEAQNNHSVLLSHCNNIHMLRNTGTICDPEKTALLKLQDSFSMSEAHKAFHRNFPAKTKDLRENHHSGRQHKFYGFHSFYYHN